MTKKEWLNLLERAAWTFVQATLGALVIVREINWKAALAGAIGAGLSALKTFIVEVAKKRLEEKDEGDA